MANHMKEVAQMLGVEFGEEFEVDFGRDMRAYITLNSTGVHIVNTSCRGINSSDILDLMLTGHCSINRKRWKPSYYQKYYSIGPGGVLEPGTWMDDFVDRALYKLGNCYSTPQDAERHRDKWIGFYNSDAAIKC